MLDVLDVSTVFGMELMIMIEMLQFRGHLLNFLVIPTEIGKNQKSQKFSSSLFLMSNFQIQ